MPTRAKGSAGRHGSEISAVDPSEIFAKIEASPPLMREQVKAAYVGKKVDCTATFLDGHVDPDGFARLAFHYDPHEVRMLIVRVALVNYPWLRTTRSGEAVRLHGRISKIENLSIELETATVTQLAEAAH